MQIRVVCVNQNRFKNSTTKKHKIDSEERKQRGGSHPKNDYPHYDSKDHPNLPPCRLTSLNELFPRLVISENILHELANKSLVVICLRLVEVDRQG